MPQPERGSAQHSAQHRPAQARPSSRRSPGAPRSPPPRQAAQPRSAALTLAASRDPHHRTAARLLAASRSRRGPAGPARPCPPLGVTRGARPAPAAGRAARRVGVGRVPGSHGLPLPRKEAAGETRNETVRPPAPLSEIKCWYRSSSDRCLFG